MQGAGGGSEAALGEGGRDQTPPPFQAVKRALEQAGEVRDPSPGWGITYLALGFPLAPPGPTWAGEGQTHRLDLGATEAAVVLGSPKMRMTETRSPSVDWIEPPPTIHQKAICGKEGRTAYSPVLYTKTRRAAHAKQRKSQVLGGHEGFFMETASVVSNP